MKNIFKKFIKFFLGKSFGQSLFRQLHLISLKGMNFGGGVDPKDSGEDFAVTYALKKIASDKLIVFDVGGNNGEYTELWLKHIKQQKKSGEFYVFEPSSMALQQLEKRFKNIEAVKINKLAISDKEGVATLYANFAGSGLASLANRDLSHVGLEMENREEVVTTTLDNFCQQQKINKIDFLKLDTEGYEFAALQGGKNMLNSKQIKFIQFEFGGTDIDTRVFFRDFYKLLNQQYKIYRILKNGLLEIEKYSELEEIFFTTNYLAELR
ncbi:MAG: FkbM family methyltransferase [Candidatus Doudnabacteria bacterium]|nr:FkbM family methyltransferase [Candidatus Doudnabacteria bacterium]